ncbi:hypothetical protein L1987_59737 [Smallanthus sonchifolius]|uniref:Uncharacterized protein n=1 Tax=Smallanthus sonchifolius TaxID=185202 RepID=A0ACB9D618_9ASTR|nr:hypothetical protein L1987_59737 [Smallanthus sonchifolius]
MSSSGPLGLDPGRLGLGLCRLQAVELYRANKSLIMQSHKMETLSNFLLVLALGKRGREDTRKDGAAAGGKWDHGGQGGDEGGHGKDHGGDEGGDEGGHED